MDMNLLSKVGLFESLETLHLAHLVSIGKVRDGAGNEVLFEEGEQGDEIFVVAQGAVRISKMVPGIGEEALAVLRPGAYFGEMEYIERNLRRAARALCQERCVLYCFPYEVMDSLMGTDRDLALAVTNAMLRSLARRLRATNDKVTAMFAMAQFG